MLPYQLNIRSMNWVVSRKKTLAVNRALRLQLNKTSVYLLSVSFDRVDANDATLLFSCRDIFSTHENCNVAIIQITNSVKYYDSRMKCIRSVHILTSSMHVKFHCKIPMDSWSISNGQKEVIFSATPGIYILVHVYKFCLCYLPLHDKVQKDFFWHQLTRVVSEKSHKMVVCVCLCVQVRKYRHY